MFSTSCAASVDGGGPPAPPRLPPVSGRPAMVCGYVVAGSSSPGVDVESMSKELIWFSWALGLRCRLEMPLFCGGSRATRRPHGGALPRQRAVTWRR
ncbi:hypothetical protein IF1G_07877 [Cordyceps javanica]|uniref:Uncharacterized protein n=1 Tax=Cordyceps javanica TaxID=43265 RepID=A0A545UV01_9HYPO|nr:hypothetical protein IF1G_07877 [Cordyceps javanica]